MLLKKRNSVPMKIAYLANCQSSHTKRWINYFKQKGHEVFTITSEVDNTLPIKQYKLRGGLRIPLASADSAFRYVFSPIAIQHVRRILINEKPDVLHAHYASHYGFIASLTNYHPLILTVWGSDILINPNQFRLLRYMVQYALRKADLITCDAKHMVKALDKLGSFHSKIHLIYFGTDTYKFNPNKRDVELRSILSSSDSPLIISLRNLELIYDIASFIKTIPIVLKKVPKAKFVVVGEGSQKKVLKDLAEKLKVSENVNFVGSVPSDEIAKYLASADIYVSTSLSDAGLAASTAEAMACGLPVIITDFGDNNRWVKDGVNGFLFPCKDIELLAEKIIHLIENKEIRVKFGLLNQDIIEKRLNHRIEMSKMENLYEVLSARRPR